jgi:hypothetical protein
MIITVKEFTKEFPEGRYVDIEVDDEDDEGN